MLRVARDDTPVAGAIVLSREDKVKTKIGIVAGLLVVLAVSCGGAAGAAAPLPTRPVIPREPPELRDVPPRAE